MEDRGAEQRALFRRWPAGVSVVVAELDGRRHGLTVSSLVSLSLDPPLVGISIALQASLHELLRDAGAWAASVLAGDQEHLAQHFARSVPAARRSGTASTCATTTRACSRARPDGSPRSRSTTLRTGDHTFFVGEVQSVEQGTAATSLSYVHRGYHAL